VAFSKMRKRWKHIMRSFALAGILGLAVLSTVAPARAADMPLKAPPAPAPYSSTWSGFYLGGNVGADWGHSTLMPAPGLPFLAFSNAGGFVITPAQFATLPPTPGSSTSLIGGGQAGYNWQVGHVVYGLEGDVDGTGLREKSASTLTRTTISGTQTVTANFSANVDWIASLRARLGYAGDRFMLYGTGGIAVAGTSLATGYAITEPPQPFFPPVPGSASDSHVVGGWTTGVGGEWAINQAWSAGVEYRHSGFGTHSYSIGISDASLAPFVGPGSTTVHFNTDEVTARLNFRFH
jgi:outer membrane immunogenic protein